MNRVRRVQIETGGMFAQLATKLVIRNDDLVAHANSDQMLMRQLP